MKCGRHGLVVNLLVSQGDMALQQNSLTPPAEPPLRKNALRTCCPATESPTLGLPLVPIALNAPEIVLKVVDVLPAQSMIGGRINMIESESPRLRKGIWAAGSTPGRDCALLIHSRTGTRNATMLPPRLEAGRLSSPLSRPPFPTGGVRHRRPHLERTSPFRDDR